jgi:hypothetical protein
MTIRSSTKHRQHERPDGLSSTKPLNQRHITKLNHMKAIPANGTRFRAMDTLSELVSRHAPVSRGSAGNDSRSSQKADIIRIENKIPAMAAARGVFN